MTIEGLIRKGSGGFYTVQGGEDLYECTLRGRHRLHRKDFLPGDRVRISADGAGGPVIEEVLPRKNRLLRPPVANVSRVLVMVSLEDPPADRVLLDRILVLCESEGIGPLIVLTKGDSERENTETVLRREYAATGYRFVRTSAFTGEGVEALGEELAGHLTVLAGQSGVGKTTLMNRLIPALSLRTGDLSEKSRSGRHTTSQIELFPYRGGFVADSPGFRRLYMPDLEPARLQFLFPEFAVPLQTCRFSPCYHDREPGCGVKEAREAGELSRIRYHHYLQFLEELREKENQYR